MVEGAGVHQKRRIGFDQAASIARFISQRPAPVPTSGAVTPNIRSSHTSGSRKSSSISPSSRSPTVSA